MNQKNKNFSKLLLLLGNSIGQLGSSILSFVLGLYILKKLNCSIFFYSLSQIIGPLVAIFLLPILGSAIDKYNKNRIIRFSQFLSAISLFLFIITSRKIEIEYIHIIGLLIILKLSDQILSTSLNSSTINIVDKDDIQSFRAHLQIIQAVSMVLSPIIAVFIIDKFALIGILLMEMFMELLVLVIYWKVDFNKNTKKEVNESQSLLILFKDGIDFIFKYKKIVFGLAFVLVVNFILGIVNIGLPFVEIKILNLSSKNYALNDSILAIGLLIGSLISSKIKSQKTLNIARNSISLISLVTFVLGLLLTLELTKNSWSIILAGYFLIIGISITICNILLSSWSILNIPQEFQGRVFSILNTLTQVSLPLSMLLFGYLFEIISVYAVFVGAGIFLLLFTIGIPSLFKINLKNDKLE
ncbi:MFS transporter [Anaerococcus vaginalis]|uniref:Transporter, major facilitator family protein n=2 Tax=Anaerococcus vaginalis TaxID=33037 RepID=C7HVM7_9FIRM|nr:MFS transporter [Anaerococcus vaginalis]EEU12032.1 transporter, major facilitator family protein [Anaerococcus vaginalis ATCC 51170]QQB61671.1 MFS transporter [Anaerococcus vaginalis]